MDGGPSPFMANLTAAEILLRNLSGALSPKELDSGKCTSAFDALFALLWTPEIRKRIGIHRLNLLLNRLKLTRIDSMKLDRLRDLWGTHADKQQSISLSRRETWRHPIAALSAQTELCWPDWDNILAFLCSCGVSNPRDLAALSFDSFVPLFGNSPWNSVLKPLWSWVREFTTRTPSLGFNEVHFKTCAHSLANQVRSACPQDASLAKGPLGKNTVEENFDNLGTLGPAAKIAKLACSDNSRGSISQMCDRGVKLNVLRQVRHSLPAVASGIECYAKFCDLLDRPYFPPTEDTILKWSAVFKPGKAFSLYLAHVMKACQLLGCDTSWLSSRVRGVATGLKNDKPTVFKPSNSLGRADLEVILGNAWENSEIKMCCFFSFIFMLRMGSEALPLIRANWDHNVNARSPQSDKAVVGLVKADNADFLCLKLNRRKNMRDGTIMRRTCTCNPKKNTFDKFCPVHILWPAVKKRVPRGKLLFPSLKTGSLNRDLRNLFNTSGLPNASHLSSHAFRKGGAQEIIDKGGSLGQLLTAGGWSSAAFLTYISTEKAEDAAFNDRSPTSTSSSN